MCYRISKPPFPSPSRNGGNRLSCDCILQPQVPTYLPSSVFSPVVKRADHHEICAKVFTNSSQRVRSVTVRLWQRELNPGARHIFTRNRTEIFAHRQFSGEHF